MLNCLQRNVLNFAFVVTHGCRWQNSKIPLNRLYRCCSTGKRFEVKIAPEDKCKNENNSSQSTDRLIPERDSYSENGNKAVNQKNSFNSNHDYKISSDNTDYSVNKDYTTFSDIDSNSKHNATTNKIETLPKASASKGARSKYSVKKEYGGKEIHKKGEVLDSEGNKATLFYTITQQDKGEEKPNKERKRKPKRIAPVSDFLVAGEQLTPQAENKVMAQIDIYRYLGESDKAINLFNFHRRHNHKFSLEAYNMIMHMWAKETSWMSVQHLRRNMAKDNLEPNHQTYAALLECCGRMMDEQKVEEILSEIKDKNITVHEVLDNSHLSSEQIEHIVDGVAMIRPSLKEEYDQSKQRMDSILRELSACKVDLYGQNIIESIDRQLDYEKEGNIEVKSIARTGEISRIQSTVDKRTEQYNEIIGQWREDFYNELLKAREKAVRVDLTKDVYSRSIRFSMVLSAEEITGYVFDNILREILDVSEGVPSIQVAFRLGELIHKKFTVMSKAQNGTSDSLKEVITQYLTSPSWFTHSREEWIKLTKDRVFSPSDTLAPKQWPKQILLLTASVLLDILIKVAKVDTQLFMKSKITKVEPALSLVYKKMETIKKINFVKAHPVMRKLFYNSFLQSGNVHFDTSLLPMCIPPRPWIAPDAGGPYLSRDTLVKKPLYQQEQKVFEASREAKMNDIYDSLNYLGNIAWMIDDKLLDLMIEVYNTTGNTKLKIVGPDLPKIEEWKERRRMSYDEKQSRKIKRKLHNELYALRSTTLYKLSIANHFRGCHFWLPNNIDFRGRAYPLSVHMSQTNDDVARGLLRFAEGKKLGERGLFWLKVHIVNLHGHLRKASLDDRHQYANENLEEIFDSADRPLTGNRWWMDGEDPWQLLGACMELTEAIRSGDPENFVSHIPVHQDGSCNGLQHYACLGRDIEGARGVNCAPGDTPRDVYIDVVNLVEQRRERDANNCDPIAQILEGKIHRKVIKQTVMTVVYNVTMIGARLQIERQLKLSDIPEELLFKASLYITKQVFDSLAEMFSSARKIQNWLTVSALTIARTGNCVDWVSPLGLPIIQPYYKEAIVNLGTPFQIYGWSTGQDYTKNPDNMKQRSAFPPNFIHSLDATHMMMTALRCRQKGITFATVHDCFWTHACDIDDMNIICRDEIVDLHERPLLEELREHFIEKYDGLPLKVRIEDMKEAKFEELPKKGNFRLEDIKDSIYFFS